MSDWCKYNPGRVDVWWYIAIYLLVSIAFETCSLNVKIAGIEQQLEQIQMRQIPHTVEGHQ